MDPFWDRWPDPPPRTVGQGGPRSYRDAPVYAVRPSASAEVVHLAITNYQPGRKSRAVYRAGAPVKLCTPGSVDPDTMVPLSVAARWPAADPDGVIRTGGGPWRWCRVCLGHLAEIHDLQQLLISRVLRTRSNHHRTGTP